MVVDVFEGHHRQPSRPWVADNVDSSENPPDLGDVIADIQGQQAIPSKYIVDGPVGLPLFGIFAFLLPGRPGRRLVGDVDLDVTPRECVPDDRKVCLEYRIHLCSPVRRFWMIDNEVQVLSAPIHLYRTPSIGDINFFCRMGNLVFGQRRCCPGGRLASCARTAACTRLSTRSLLRIALTWIFTVPSIRCSRRVELANSIPVA